MQQNHGVVGVTVQVLEAERRANEDLTVIFKALAAEDTFVSCQDSSKRWAALQLMLIGMKLGGFDSDMAKRVIHAGMVRRLIKYLVDFQSLATKSNVARVDEQLNVTPWYCAMFTLGGLADLLRGASTPECLELLAEYRRFGRDLIRTYCNMTIFWWGSGEVPGDTHLQLTRTGCLATLMPLIEEPFCKGKVPISDWDDVCAATPLIAGLRRSIRLTPTSEVAQFFAKSTAELLNGCVLAARTVKPKYEWSVEIMTGLPYSELIRQCLTCTGHNLEDLSIPVIETNLFASMVEIDNSPVFQDVIASHKIISWIASIMRFAMSHHEEITVILRPPGRIVKQNWGDRMISTFRLILDRARMTGDERPAVETVNSSVLHLIEWWSPAASGRKLDGIKFICRAMSSLLTQPEIRAQMENQLRTISIRMEARYGITPEVTRTWKEAYESNVRFGYPASAMNNGPVCTTLGCESLAPAEMMCSRCTRTYYCCQACQKSDWKWHKPHCKR